MLIIPSTPWSRRPIPGQDVMNVIITGFWDDAEIWEDNLFWFDAGQTTGSPWTARTMPATPNWS